MNNLNRYIIGIDLGLQGGISCLKYELNEDFNRKLSFNIEFIESFEMPRSYKRLYEIIKKWDSVYSIDEVIIEKALIVTGNSKATLQSIAKNYGACSAVCEIAELSYREVSPNDWQKIIKEEEINKYFQDISNKKKEIKDIKLKSLSKVFSLFPQTPLISKRGKLLDGIADSIMIAYWGIFHSKEEHQELLKERAKAKKKRKARKKAREANKTNKS